MLPVYQSRSYEEKLLAQIEAEEKLRSKGYVKRACERCKRKPDEPIQQICPKCLSYGYYWESPEERMERLRQEAAAYEEARKNGTTGGLGHIEWHEKMAQKQNPSTLVGSAGGES